MTKGKWTTKNGVEMEIKDMETSHIENTIKFLKKNMPENEEDEYLTADHWSLPGVYLKMGAIRYKEKITEFEKELSTRHISPNKENK